MTKLEITPVENKVFGAVFTNVKIPETELAHYPEDPQAQAGRDALNAELAELRQEAKGKMFEGSTRTREQNSA